jgi:hypothetical protein
MSTLRVNNITDNSGGTNNLNVPGTAKAWVNFNGTGTVAIRASFNVSSITDNGTGDYTVNFTTAMPDANYSTQIMGAGVAMNQCCCKTGFIRFSSSSATTSIQNKNTQYLRQHCLYRHRLPTCRRHLPLGQPMKPTNHLPKRRRRRQRHHPHG